MFINIKILSKNQKSLKNFIIIFNSFCLKNLKNKDFYTVKRKNDKNNKNKVAK